MGRVAGARSVMKRCACISTRRLRINAASQRNNGLLVKNTEEKATTTTMTRTRAGEAGSTMKMSTSKEGNAAASTVLNREMEASVSGREMGDAMHVDGDEDFMHVALSMARTAFRAGEVPVGAAAVHAASGTIVATAHNESEQRHDPTAHAEMLCLRRAAQHPLLTQGWRDLRGVTLYVTLEPCAMCAGAVLQVRELESTSGCICPR